METNYGCFWRKDVINQCFKFVIDRVHVGARVCVCVYVYVRAQNCLSGQYLAL